MNINSVNQQNNVAVRRIFAQQNNKKTADASQKKNKNASDSLIDNVKEMMEEKKKQMMEVKTNSDLSDKLKEIKLDILEDQYKELEKQLNQAIVDQQKREAEELVKQQKENEKQEDNNESAEEIKAKRFINTFSKVAFNFDSIHQNKIMKAEKERESTRIEIEMRNDAENGIIGGKADELYKSEVTKNNLENEINEKVSDINEEIKEYREKEIEEAQKPEDKKSEEEKLEEELLEGKTQEEISNEEASNEEISNKETPKEEISIEEASVDFPKKENPLAALYGNNSFENYRETESEIDAHR